MAKVKEIVELGDVVRDTITGYEGVAIGRTTWLTGCDRITVQAKGLTKDGKPYEMCTFDIGMLEVVKKKKAPETDRSKGGPAPMVSKY